MKILLSAENLFPLRMNFSVLFLFLGGQKLLLFYLVAKTCAKKKEVKYNQIEVLHMKAFEKLSEEFANLSRKMIAPNALFKLFS